MPAVGIEKIRVYPTTGRLAMEDLARARGFDVDGVRTNLMVDHRGVSPPWEDAVTLAVNAAKPILTDEDRRDIGLLIVASESGVDQEKPISSWVHRYLDLNPHCRNFEVKHACYGATGAMQMALAWLASDIGGDQKALVINADQSLLALEQPYEPVTGAAAVAVLLSRSPRLVAYELGRCGYYSADYSDVMRPTPRVETGNSESSLLSYLEALEHAYHHFLERTPEAGDFRSFFDWHVYHMPFAGMALRAHRALAIQASDCTRAEAKEDFQRKVAASTHFTRQMGGVYGASTFIGLLGLVDDAARARSGGRVGIFAYGSGLCAEYHSAQLLPAAAEVAAEAALQDLIDARRPLTVDEYEWAERDRDAGIMAQDHVPDRDGGAAWYDAGYAGRGRLVLNAVRNYQRDYGWS